MAGPAGDRNLTPAQTLEEDTGALVNNLERTASSSTFVSSPYLGGGRDSTRPQAAADDNTSQPLTDVYGQSSSNELLDLSDDFQLLESNTLLMMASDAGDPSKNAAMESGQNTICRASSDAGLSVPGVMGYPSDMKAFIDFVYDEVVQRLSKNNLLCTSELQPSGTEPSCPENEFGDFDNHLSFDLSSHLDDYNGITAQASVEDSQVLKPLIDKVSDEIVRRLGGAAIIQGAAPDPKETPRLRLLETSQSKGSSAKSDSIGPLQQDDRGTGEGYELKCEECYKLFPRACDVR